MHCVERSTEEGATTMKNASVMKRSRIPAILAPGALLYLILSLSTDAWGTDLMHNSRDTSSTKWEENGGWGVAGGKYGEFTCATCHEPNVYPNIKNIRRMIRTPDGSNWPNGESQVEVSFRNSTSMGDDRDGHRTSSRICEVCHSKNRFHNADTANNIDNGGNLTHPTPQAVCTSCHKHGTGFKAACGGCHGNPPTTAETGGDYGLIGTPRPSLALPPGEAGAHATHTQTRSMMCDTCHFIDNGTVRMPNLSNSIDIGFFGFGGRVRSGTYLPYTTAGRGYRVAAGTAGTVIAPASSVSISANLCLNVYCHGGGSTLDGKPPLTGGTNITPRWDGVSQNACGSCHGTTSDRPVTTGGHPKHAGSSDGYSFSCDLCHPVSGDNSHVQGNLRWAFKENDPRTSGGGYRPDGFLSPEPTGSTGNLAPSVAYGDCWNLYCHSDGRGGFSTPTWGGNLLADCTGCHGGSSASSRPITSRGHGAHVANTSSRFAGFNFRCDECHAGIVDTAATTVTDRTKHVNGQGDVLWGSRSSGGATYSTNGCTQIYCHSNGQGTYKSPPLAWNAIPDGQQGTITCDYCHGGNASDPTPVSSMRHTNHIENGPLPHRPVPCNWCHSSTVGSDGHSVYNGLDVTHINRRIDVTFLKMDNFSGSYDPSTKVCGNTWCHGNNATTSVRDWDTTTINTCGNCHEANNSTKSNAKLSDAHRKHYNTSTRPSSTTEQGWTSVNLSSTNNVFMCGVCHPGNPTVTHVNGPATPDGVAAEVALRLPFTPPAGAARSETVTRGSGVNYDGRGYGYSTGTTCDTYCHSDGRGGAAKTVMAWAVSTTSCGNCHNQASDNPLTTTWSKPHDTHANRYGNGGMIGANNTTSNNPFVTCAACHASTASSNTALLTGQRAKHPNGFRNISASSAVGSAAFRWDPATNSCKNGYCHSRAYSFSDYSTPWIRWDLSQDIHCGSCHTSYPSGPDYPSGYKGKANSHPKHAVYWGFSCDWCHDQTVAFRNVTTMYISTVRNHVNKNYNVVANTSRTFIGRSNSFTPTVTTNPPTVATTCTSVACHGGNSSTVFTWGGANKCGECHLTTAAETVFYGFSRTPSTIATVNSTEWGYSGHGKSSGSYDVTGNPAANFPGSVTSAGDQCLFCHDYGIGHGTPSNPLRLRNFSHPTWGKNGVCLVCHASGGGGVDPDGPGTVYTFKSATRKVDKYHYGTRHSDTLSGGQFCWDCHDAHGDRASATDGRPIAMVQKKPTKRSDPATGLPIFFTATTVRFTARSAPDDFISTSAPYRGICNVCHDYKSTDPNRMVHYTATSSDGHQSSTLCTTCHKHSKDSTSDGNAYAAASDCNACHDYDTRDGGRVWGMNPISPVKEGFGAHARHIQYIKSRWGLTLNPASDIYGTGAAAAVCGVCHSNLLGDHTPDTPVNPRSITFGWSTARRFGGSGPTYNGNSGTSSSVNPKSCSNLDCHYRTSPVW